MSERYAEVGKAYGWLAEDGQHVWLRHDCGGESVTVYLPHPQWRRSQAGTLTPSFHCELCGYHEFPVIYDSEPGGVEKETPLAE